MSRAMLHLMNRELARGWVCWHAQWLEVTWKRASMSKSLLHLMNRELSRGWVGWLALVIGRAHAFHAVQRSLVHWVMSAVLVAFGNWRRRAAVDTAHSAQLARYIAVFSEPHALKAAMRLAWQRWRREVSLRTRNVRLTLALALALALPLALPLALALALALALTLTRRQRA